MSQEVNVRELYTRLKERAKGRAGQYSLLNLLVRLSDGIKREHSSIVLNLFWLHILLTDRSLFSRLKNATDEASMRQILDGRVRTSYVQGEKTIALDSCIFPPEFFEIIDAYLDYTDELCRK